MAPFCSWINLFFSMTISTITCYTFAFWGGCRKNFEFSWHSDYDICEVNKIKYLYFHLNYWYNDIINGITYKSPTLIIDNAFSSRTFITRFYLLSIEYAFLSVCTILPCICLEFSRVCYAFSIKCQSDIKIVLRSRKIMWTNTLFFRHSRYRAYR